MAHKIWTRFDIAEFDNDVFDFILDSGVLDDMKVDFDSVLANEGHDFIWRVRNFTIDSDFGVPTAESAPTDTSILGFLLPMPKDYENLDRKNSQFVRGTMKVFTKNDFDIQPGDFLFDKDEDSTGFSTIAGTNATTVVLSGDQRGIFNVYDYISIDDADNDDLYQITAVSYDSTNTTLTVAFDADPGTGDTIYKAAVWFIKTSQELPANNTSVFRQLIIEKRQN